MSSTDETIEARAERINAQLTAADHRLMFELNRVGQLNTIIMDASECRRASRLVKLGICFRGTADEGDARSKVYYLTREGTYLVTGDC